MLQPVRTVAPTVDVITLEEAKTHCRVDGSDEDMLITALIEAATAHLDGYSGTLGRALITQTWRQDFDGFSDFMRLPVGNLQAVSSVTYYDADNATQTLATSVYTSFSDEIGPFITLKPDEEWPTSYTRQDAVRVTWTAGYGTAASNVPGAIRAAMLLLIGHWYTNREAIVSDKTTAELPMAVNTLLAPFRRVGT